MSNLKRKFWEFKNSLYVIFAFFSLACVSFFYIGHKTNNKKWTKTGILYLILIFIPIVDIVAYFVGIVKILETRKEYLYRLENKQLRDEIYKEYSPMGSKIKKSSKPAKGKDKPAGILSDNEYVKQIYELTEKITKIEVRKQLIEIEFLCGKIFEYVKEHLESEYRIKPLVNYYLPELFTQMEKYIELDRNAHLDIPNIQVSMSKIESLLPMIKDASTNIYNLLLDDSLLDINNDIEVLRNQLNQNS